MAESSGEISTVINKPSTSWSNRLKNALHIGSKDKAPLFRTIKQSEQTKTPAITLSQKAGLDSKPLDPDLQQQIDH